MVFGLFEGKIELMLERYNFSYGDTIKGKLNLQLNKPKKARQLRVSLVCQETVRSTSLRRGGVSSTSETHDIYRFNLPLGGEKEYSGTGEYDFELKVPQPSGLQGQMPKLEGLAGAFVGAAMAAAGPRFVKWFVDASLDVPMSFDINKKADITVS